MLRFDRLIRPGSIIRDIKREFPQTVPVFESFGFRNPCDDCSVEQVARKYGIPVNSVLDALNRTVMEQPADQ